MSTQRGNVSKNRSQKHENNRAFKNDLYDSTPQTKLINSLVITDVCKRCKGVLEWKIKYKKYKIQKNPSTCTKCNQRNVTKSYRIICAPCAEKFCVCPKCGLTEEERIAEALAAAQLTKK
ncbi:unnamed protein product [Nesidiocoris tenuis]|uniref:Uncharacterized conserved protein (DUF2039) n=2 Tax=Nesidiocoris tenuis TaxID=355587 RepID=A0ABN7B9I4_9HEMI|nr:Uncharacterized conserved protein (DUF2039) [Nesidiocoris tenuis]CAB0004945.1 unnamed protein product [Nesidiocoris tenuis]